MRSIFRQLVLSSFLALGSSSAALAFESEIIDGNEEFAGLYNEVAVDILGNPHVVYGIRQSGCPPWFQQSNLMYATKSAGTWVIEEVPDSPCEPHIKPSVAVAADGTVHVIFVRSTVVDELLDSRLVYGRRDGGGWSFETIEETGEDTALDPRLTLDGLGRPHVSYGVEDPEVLKYGTRTESGWSVEVVDATDTPGAYTDITVDADGYAWISYAAYGTYQIRAAHQTSSGWQTEVVDASADFSGCSTIGVDAEGEPHLGYATTDGGLIHAHRDAGTWVIDEVPMGPVTALYEVRLAVTSSGRPHIVVPDRSTGELYYFVFASGFWAHYQIDDGPVGRYSAIALDGDVAHIVYHDAEAGDLRYVGESLVAGVPGASPISVPALVSVHPNPSLGEFQLALAAGLGSAGSVNESIVVVHDLQGRVCATLAPRGTDARSARFEVPPSLPAGRYLLDVRVAGRRVDTVGWTLLE